MKKYQSHSILVLACAFFATLPIKLVAGTLEEDPVQSHDMSSIDEEETSWYRLAGIYQYLQLDYLDSANAVAYTLELENQFSFEHFDVENRLILDYSDYPATIEDFAGNPFPVNGAGSGFGDILVGTFFAPKNQGSRVHLGFGPVVQAPTAGDDHLGSGKWTAAPGIHLQYHKDRLSAGLFLWNSWSFAGDSNRKNINQMTMKPYFIYELSDKWNVLYVPLGISATWEKPSSERWKIPLGGGLGRKFHVGEQEMEFQAQTFYSVRRPEKAAEWSLRFTLEMPF